MDENKCVRCNKELDEGVFVLGSVVKGDLYEMMCKDTEEELRVCDRCSEEFETWFEGWMKS